MTIVEEMDEPVLSDTNWKDEESTPLIKPPVQQSQQRDKFTCSRFLKSLTVEPFMALFMFSYVVGRVCSQNIFMDKTCLNIFGFPANICSNIDNYTKEKQEIETTADNYNLYNTLIQTVPAVFFSMVIGPWSDKYGRKLPVIFALIGLGLENVGIILNIIYFDAPLYWMVLSALPSGIFGGFTVTLMCMYSLISEQTTKKQRTIKYALLELAYGVGIPLGTFIGGMVYKKYGYIYVYITGIVSLVMAIMWLIIVVKDNRNLRNTLNGKIVCDLFSFQNFKESYGAVTKPRPNRTRLEIWLLIGSMCALISTYTAMSGFAFYFAKEMYKWDVTTYSNVSSAFLTAGMFFVVFAVPVLVKVFKMKDYCLGIIGSISMFSSDIVKGFAYKTWLYYLGNGLGIFGTMGMLAVRARLSKIVSEEELGKIFAFLSSCESLVPVAGNLIFTQIFNASIHVFPGMAYVIAGAIIILPIIVFPWIGRKKNLDNELLEDKPEQTL
ncbi:probable peptidoglycan muropeptide transporter SLC46 [Centruroides vittatus]|uniref:probable peptidoglycan muropeptide transporter SLC46 n=1 Tax=Centruroides vittatus TaxID=120091 RepID=UPI00350EFA00